MSGESWMMAIGVTGTLLSALYVAVTPPRTTVVWTATSGRTIRRSVEHGPASTGHRIASTLALASVAIVLLAASGLVVDS